MSLIRLIFIIATFAHYRLDNLINIKKLSWNKKLLLALMPWRYFISNKASRGIRIRKFLEDLGPIFVKFGQLLSTRKDLIAEDISIELAKLQDNVPPFATEKAIKIIENSLAVNNVTKSINELFKEFNETPLASASVAQVHAATLHTGEQVVIKVIRPKIKATILKDINILLFFVKVLTFLFSEVERLHLTQIVLDYKQTILDELNLLREAANAAQLRHNFRSSSILYIPKIYWDYCSKSILVMERIQGIAVTDIETLKSANVNMEKVASRGIEIFFTQVFRDSFFHADMHPGNIWLDISNPEEPKYLGLDFGIVGSLEPEDQYYLAANMLAFFKRDYRKIAQLHIQSGWVPADTTINSLESAIRTVCEPIFGKPLKQISFGLLLVRLFRVARRFKMELQPQLVLLEKTLLNIEGLGRQLCPELNLWETAQPFLENWMQQKGSFSVLRQQLRQQGMNFILSAPVLTQKINATFAEFKQIKTNLLLDQQNKHTKRKQAKKLGYLLLATSLFAFYNIEHIELVFPNIALGSSLIGLWLLFTA